MRIAIALFIAALILLVWSQLGSEPAAPPPAAPVAVETPEELTPARDDEEQRAPVTDASPEDSQTGDEPRRVVVNSQSDFFTIMAELGLDNLEQRFSEWSLAHGYPFSDQTGVLLLEQPYDQYDDDTLRAFAENEDMWAQQFLAQRLEKTRPAEAIDWYRKAAINGSLYAMDQLTALYGRLGRARADGPDSDEIYKQQLLAVRDSVQSTQEMGFAWSMASVMAGGDPGRNRLSLEAMSRTFDDEQMQSACDMATSLYSDISTQRQNRGLDDFSRSPPPLMMGRLSEASSLPCGGETAVPFLDVSSCEEVVIDMAGSENEMVVCRN